MTTPGVWNWRAGIAYHKVHYIPNSGEAEGSLDWIEEVSPMDDDRGNGTYASSSQPLTDFLQTGPSERAPVQIVEGILTHLQAEKPEWLDSYRLQEAVRTGDAAAVEGMLRDGVLADMPVRGLTAFYFAITMKDLAIAERIFAAGVDGNRRFQGAQDTILKVLARYAPDASWEPLAQRIITQGADLEAQNQWGETPLMAAASTGNRLPGLVSMLLTAGADVNARSLHGYTPLWKTVSYRDAATSTIRQLIAAGADVNVCDQQGWTVLMVAISCRLVEGVRCLIAAGADVQAISAPTRQYEKPQSVLQVALAYANPEIVQQIQAAIS